MRLGGSAKSGFYMMATLAFIGVAAIAVGAGMIAGVVSLPFATVCTSTNGAAQTCYYTSPNVSFQLPITGTIFYTTANGVTTGGSILTYAQVQALYGNAAASSQLIVLVPSSSITSSSGPIVLVNSATSTPLHFAVSPQPINGNYYLYLTDYYYLPVTINTVTTASTTSSTINSVVTSSGTTSTSTSVSTSVSTITSTVTSTQATIQSTTYTVSAVITGSTTTAVVTTTIATPTGGTSTTLAGGIFAALGAITLFGLFMFRKK